MGNIQWNPLFRLSQVGECKIQSLFGKKQKTKFVQKYKMQQSNGYQVIDCAISSKQTRKKLKELTRKEL